jgi:predicted NodU family carbamoyl transferase
MGHHTSHCIGAYHQSGFKNALVISLDGGGIEYNQYGISKDPKGTEISYSILKITDKKIEVLLTSSFPGAMEFTPGSYTALIPAVSEIDAFKGDKTITEFIKALFNAPDMDIKISDSPFWKMREMTKVCAGKFMGLAAYGKIRDEWIDAVKQVYLANPNQVHTPRHIKSLLISFASIVGVCPDQNWFSGQDSYDLAATNQYVFEELCWKLIKSYIDDHNLDVILSGGCALNVLSNQKIVEYLSNSNRKLFVSPNPGDDGLSYGHVCSVDKTFNDQFSVYCGLDILDREKIPYYYNKYKENNKVVKL